MRSKNGLIFGVINVRTTDLIKTYQSDDEFNL